MKPILFNTEMVRAILDDRKTVTRRVIKYQCPADPTKTLDDFIGTSDPQLLASCAPYKTGDVLYVRETWRVGAWDIREQEIAFDYKDGTCGPLIYLADKDVFERLVCQSREDARKGKCEYNGVDFVWEKGNAPTRWHPSIHMPKEAARLFLHVTDVRVERLHDITDAGAVAEGIKPEILLCSFRGPEFPEPLPDEPIGCVSKFIELWDSTIKPADFDRYGWRANPWVWAIEFERISKEQAKADEN